MPDPSKPVSREAIEKTARGIREHLAAHGQSMSREAVINRVIAAQERADKGA